LQQENDGHDRHQDAGRKKDALVEIRAYEDDYRNVVKQ
jgi:hypothetical protein